MSAGLAEDTYDVIVRARCDESRHAGTLAAGMLTAGEIDPRAFPKLT